MLGLEMVISSAGPLSFCLVWYDFGIFIETKQNGSYNGI